jgi:hypothetical protein
MAHLTREEVLKSGEVAPEYRKVHPIPTFTPTTCTNTNISQPEQIHIHTRIHP